MNFLLACLDPERARNLLLALENEDESWRCACAETEADVWAGLTSGRADAALIEPILRGMDGRALLRRLWQEPPTVPPKLLCPGADASQVDAYLPRHAAEAELLRALIDVGRSPALPKLTRVVLPRLEASAEALLQGLGMKSTLSARAFLPRMIALCVASPQLLQRLTADVYPRFAAEYGCTSAAVERNLRSAIESLWSTGALPALEEHFGHTVDPEKGRPTNRAFLAQTAEFVRAEQVRQSAD